MHSKSLTEQTEFLDYSLVSCSHDELFTLNQTSTALEESISLHFENPIELAKNAKSDLLLESRGEMSITPVEGAIEIKVGAQTGILPVETFKNIASQMNRKSILSLKSSCGFFNTHPVVKERLTEWNHFEVFPESNRKWFLTSDGRLYRRLYSGELVECFADFIGEDIIKQVFFSPIFYHCSILRGTYYESSIYFVTQSNKLFYSNDCSLDATPSEIALNLQEGETIKIAVAAKHMVAITTSFNRFILYYETTVEDISHELGLSENEYVKQVEITYNYHIFVLTSKNRIFEYAVFRDLKKTNYLGEFSEYRLLAGNNEFNGVIAVTKNNEIILINTETNKQQQIDIQLKANEVVSEFAIYHDCVVALTSAGRVFISDEHYKFEEWDIQGLKGEQVKHIKNNYGTYELILITDSGRMVSTQTFYRKDNTRKVDEVVLGEEDLLKRYEEQSFGLF